MVCGPEIARMVKEFEHVTILKDEDTQFRHHEDTPGFQRRFNNHYTSLMKEFEKLGNPFICDSPNELIQIDTRDIMSENVVNTINKIEDIGRKQAETFINDRIVDKKIPIDAPITKNKLPLISNKRSPGAAKSSVALEKKKGCRSFLKTFHISPSQGR